MTNEATRISEKHIDEAPSVAKLLNDDDAKLVARWKRLGFWTVMVDGLPVWGHA